jgi:hypothetical protein
VQQRAGKIIRIMQHCQQIFLLLNQNVKQERRRNNENKKFVEKLVFHLRYNNFYNEQQIYKKKIFVSKLVKSYQIHTNKHMYVYTTHHISGSNIHFDNRIFLLQIVP